MDSQRPFFLYDGNDWMISKGRTSQKVINLLAADGWQLLFVVNTCKNAGMLASLPNFLYYFKKD